MIFFLWPACSSQLVHHKLGLWSLQKERPLFNGMYVLDKLNHPNLPFTCNSAYRIEADNPKLPLDLGTWAANPSRLSAL
jgi:hypothetical protein